MKKNLIIVVILLVSNFATFLVTYTLLKEEPVREKLLKEFDNKEKKINLSKPKKKLSKKDNKPIINDSKGYTWEDN